jgi:hypothetical protein
MAYNNLVISVDHSKKGNDDQILTSWELQAGAPPHGIILQRFANDCGIIGDDVNSWPTENSWMFIPHARVVRSPFGRASREGVPTVDETFYVKAFTVGDPR